MRCSLRHVAHVCRERRRLPSIRMRRVDHQSSGARLSHSPDARFHGADDVASLKSLRSVAHNLCAQLGSTLNYWKDDYALNHFARAVRAAGGQVRVDLLAGTSLPVLPDSGRNLVMQLSSILPALLQKEGFAPDMLVAGMVSYNFQTSRPDHAGCPAYDCVVQLEAEGGRTYVVELSEKNIG